MPPSSSSYFVTSGGNTTITTKTFNSTGPSTLDRMEQDVDSTREFVARQDFHQSTRSLGGMASIGELEASLDTQLQSMHSPSPSRNIAFGANSRMTPARYSLAPALTLSVSTHKYCGY